MLKSLRVKTQFFVDSRMSTVCGMWHVDIFSAPTVLYYLVGAVQSLHCYHLHYYHFEDRNVDTVSSSQNDLLSL
jgi:hypothetical protein